MTKSVTSIINRAAFSDQYKTKEWREFSRNIRDMTNFCEVCKRGSGLVKLNVHHFAYDPNRAIWEYERDEVAVLCEECHEEMHHLLQQFRKSVFGYLTPKSMRVLNESLQVAQSCRYDPLKTAYAIAEMINSPRSIELFSEAWTNRPLPPAA